MTTVGIALGTNLGDRRGNIAWAVEQLAGVLSNTRTSRIIETEPVDVPEPQPPYLNAVVVGETALSAAALLEALNHIEERRGRTRPGYHAARTLDLDLVFYGDAVISTASLTVPHPRFRTRRFVLEPLVDVAPTWMDPVTGLSAGALLAALDAENESTKEKGA